VVIASCFLVFVLVLGATFLLFLIIRRFTVSCVVILEREHWRPRSLLGSRFAERGLCEIEQLQPPSKEAAGSAALQGREAAVAVVETQGSEVRIVGCLQSGGP
jgi:hypothetical protein